MPKWKENQLPGDVFVNKDGLLQNRRNGRLVFFVDGAFKAKKYRRDAGCAFFCGPNLYESWADEANRPTNNTSELGAIKHALNVALFDKKLRGVEIRTDSKYAWDRIKVHSRKWRKNGGLTAKRTSVANQQLIEECQWLVENYHVVLRWIPRGENHIADRMAKDAREGKFEME